MFGGNRRMHHIVRRLARQPARRVAGDQGLGESGHGLVLVEVLRCEVQSFVGGGHPDADGDQ